MTVSLLIAIMICGSTIAGAALLSALIGLFIADEYGGDR